MKKQRAILSLILSLVLLCSFVMPSLAASYQNGSTGKVTVSGVWAFAAGVSPAKRPAPATAAIGAITTTTGCTGTKDIRLTSSKWTGASTPRNTTAKLTFTAFTSG